MHIHRALPRLLLSFLPCLPLAAADLTVADIFSSHMVLQRDCPVPVWGTASPGQTVTITFADSTITATTDPAGRWTATLAPLSASAKPASLTVDGGTHIVFDDVLVGEVWHASGQSNMEWKLSGSAQKLPAAKALLDAADNPLIRYRSIRTKDQPTPQAIIGDGRTWTVCTPATAADYSAVAYVFASELQKKLSIPVGIIETAWGGHPIEPFIPRTAFVDHPTLLQEAELGDKEDLPGLKAMAGGVFARNNSWLPGRIFNSRIAPVAPYAIRGALWYQAESNCGTDEDPRFYAEKMQALIRGWRAAWHNDTMPVYYIQLPQYNAAGWVPMRDQQRRAMTEPNTGMTVIIDLIPDGIHPPNKIDVGQRLVRWPLSQLHGFDIEPTGPLLSNVQITGNTVLIAFTHIGQGLAAGRKTDLQPTEFPANLPLTGFELAGADGIWHPADARIVGGTVTCTTPAVTAPTQVRYAWAPTMPTDRPWTLYNLDGLPASPFLYP